MIKSEEGLAALLPRVEGNPTAMLFLAGLLRKQGQTEQALELARKALALAPQNPELVARARAFFSRDVPEWHFALVGDAVRNAAYDAALRRAIKPGMRVLEIGTGTGILAMMAARAGAAQVVTCEMNPTIAQTARDIVERNGYSDRVRVFSGHSDKLTLEALGGPADILVSEILSSDLLSEDVLPAHEKAMRHLMKPGAQVIPARARVRVALAEDVIHDKMKMGCVDGFDLSPFNALLAPSKMWRIGENGVTLRSAPSDLFAFDLGSDQYCAPTSTELICRAAGGRVNGIAQWIALELDAETHYENSPAAGAKSAWGLMVYSLPNSIETTPGQQIRIVGSHDRHRLTLWSEDL